MLSILFYFYPRAISKTIIKIKPIITPIVPNLSFFDVFIPHMHINKETPEGISSSWSRKILLVLAITLHNIPEGLAIGVAFGTIATGLEGASLASAWILAIGIGLQNFPEGMAVSVPLRSEGIS